MGVLSDDIFIFLMNGVFVYLLEINVYKMRLSFGLLNYNLFSVCFFLKV